MIEDRQPRAAAPPPAGQQAAPPPAGQQAAAPRTEPQRRFDVDGQRAGVISNVAGNQYNAALRITPMRRRARRLMRLGVLVMLAGFVVFIVGAVRFGSMIVHCSQTSCTNPSLGGWALAAVGVLSGMVGGIVVLASLFMKREARREAGRL
jgi:hypothetical protein